MKLLVRGEAIAAGKGVTSGYPDIIAQHPDFKHFELINISREDDNSFDAVWTFEKDINPHRPDILLLHFGMNDAYYPVYRSEFKENLVQLIRLARNRFDPHILLATSHPFENPYDMNMLHIYYRTIREVALDLACVLVPVHIYFWSVLEESNIPLSDFLQQDSRWPNEKGHALYAEIIMEHVKKLIRP